LGLGIAALLSIGIVLLALAGVLASVGALVPALRGRGMLAIPAGVGLAPLYLAWLNRDGPGTVCESTPTMTKCEEEWSPWPFVVVAALFVVTSVILARRRSVA
jgi:hypothetical protein